MRLRIESSLPPADLPVHCRDPKDDKVLAAALGAGADYIVTGDDDLLTLAGDSRLGKLQIVRPRQFLDILSKQEPKDGEQKQFLRPSELRDGAELALPSSRSVIEAVPGPSTSPPASVSVAAEARITLPPDASPTTSKRTLASDDVPESPAGAIPGLMSRQADVAGNPATPRRMQSASTDVGAVSPLTIIGLPGGGIGKILVTRAGS